MMAKTVPATACESVMTFPGDKGTYILILHLESAAHLNIGRLGAFDFPAGWYTYTGSAFGPGGLRGRLKHHLAPIMKPHWHIDYLRAAARLYEVWWIASETVHEHRFAAALRTLTGAAIPAARFGASDCACPAHLVYFPAAPDPDQLQQRVAVSLQRTPVP